MQTTAPVTLGRVIEQPDCDAILNSANPNLIYGLERVFVVLSTEQGFSWSPMLVIDCQSLVLTFRQG